MRSLLAVIAAAVERGPPPVATRHGLQATVGVGPVPTGRSDNEQALAGWNWPYPTQGFRFLGLNRGAYSGRFFHWSKYGR